MLVNKKTFLRSFRSIFLMFIFIAGVISVVASGGGGGDGGSGTTTGTEDTGTPQTPLAVNWEDEFEECDPTASTESDLPRRIQFSDDGLRLVTGLGEQDDFYYFSTTDNSDIKRIDLYFSQADWWDQMTNNYESETEIPATLTYDKGAEEPRTLESKVGVRFRGDTSYTRNNTEKKSFNISLDFVDLDQEIDGFKNLNLNCAWGDHTFMREVIYEHINQFYIPAASVNYVELYINDEYWGIYINSQQLDNNFYREWFTSTCGTNWRAESPTQTGPGGFNTGFATLNYLGDNTDDYTPYYTMKRYSVDDPWQDLINACYALENTSTDEPDYEDIVGQVLDIDRALWFLAMEIIFGDEDSYVNKGGRDYYVYWDYTTGLLTPIEYDGNSTLLALGAGGGGPIGGARGDFLEWDPYANRLDDADFPLINKLLYVPSIRQRYLAHVRTVLKESVNPTNMNSMIDDYVEKIEPYISDDPKTFITDFAGAVSGLKDAVQTRYDTLMGHADVNVTGLTISDVKWIVGGVEWAMPSSSDKVTINATVTGSMGVDSVWAYEGEGIESTFAKVEMLDDGLHGDGAADDGVYGVILDEKASGVRTRFYIEAIAADTPGTRTYDPARAAHDVFTFKVDGE